MTVVPYNGHNYNIPSTTEENWSGPYAVDGLLIAFAANSLNPQGGLFALQNDLDFGPTAGTAAVYYKSRASDIAQGGVFRFGHADTINWRNAANTADLPFGVDSLNRATFNGTLLLASAGVVSASRALASDGSGNVVSSAVTATELGYVSGVTSAIQTQISANAASIATKEPAITTLSVAKGGTNSGTTLNNNRVMQSSSGSIVEAAAITASRALVSDTNGIPTHSSVTSTELGYLSGVTSTIQTQINAKQTSGVDQKVIVTGGNGHGSTNTNIRRFTTTEATTGTAITYADSATLGGSFTITSAGIYALTYSDANTSASMNIGISVNSAQLTTNIVSITAANRKAYAGAGTNIGGHAGWVGRLAANDVVRAHTDASPNATAAWVRFEITKIAD